MSTTERAVDTLLAAIARRGANVSAVFTRVEAAALDKAADVGIRVIPESFPLPRDHDAARRAAAKLTAAMRRHAGELGRLPLAALDLCPDNVYRANSERPTGLTRELTGQWRARPGA